MITTMDKTLEQYKTECEQFANDIKYRKMLAQEIGLSTDEYYLLRPITGEEEFKFLLQQAEEKNFMPGNKLDLTKMDSHDDRYLKSGDFRINLHVHSQFSDGKLTIEEFLRQAKELADKNYQKTHHTPALLIAITDHDCIDGAKEVLKQVANNPTIYKNVRFVLGVELSTITNKLKNLKKPILIHTHMFCINPFDKEFNALVNEKRNLKIKLAQETIEKIKVEFAQILKEYNTNFSFEDIGKIHQLILKGEDEINLPLIKYVSAKLFFEYKVLHNEKILNILSKNNITPNTLHFQDVVLDHKPIIRRKGGILANYDDALVEYLRAKVSKDITKDIIPPENEKIKQIIAKTKEIGAKAHPTMTNFPQAFYEFEETLKTLSNQKYGVFGIAHPARTIVKDIEANIIDIFRNMFEVFKKFGGNKALYYEGYYQSYFGKDYTNCLEAIEIAAKEQALIKTGGMDSHGNDIKWRTEQA